MRIVLNGEPREIAPATTIGRLLSELGLGEGRVAVERNREVVPRSLHAEATLTDGDEVEIVHFVGGG